MNNKWSWAKFLNTFDINSMNLLKNSLYFLVSFVCFSCANENTIENLSEQKTISNKDLVFHKTYYVKDSVTIENCSITFVDTSIFIMGKNAKIVFKNCVLLQPEKKEYFIHFKPKESADFWDRLYFYDCNVILENAKFDEGLISCINSTASLKNIELTTKKNRIKDQKYPFIHLIKSDGTVANCLLDNSLKKWNGEGIIIENGSVSIHKNTINYVPDGIELIRCSNSFINENYIANSFDDGIDINDSKNIIISNNTIINSRDKGISIGSHFDRNRKNEKIIIKNNIIKNSKIGIAIKNSSEAILSNNIFENNETDYVK